MLKNLPNSLSDYTFIDIGCGKGRTLILSRSYSFYRAIGVEFPLELVETAQKNLVTINRNFPGGASVVHQDAALYGFPRGPLVVYLYNPFGPEVMGKVIQNLVNQISSRADDCYVIYGSSNAATLTWSNRYWPERACLRNVPQHQCRFSVTQYERFTTASVVERKTPIPAIDRELHSAIANKKIGAGPF